MADLPEHLDPARHRDVSARAELTARRTLLVVLTAIAGLALVGLFGQSPSSSTASGESAELEVSAPPRVRGGLFFQGRFTIDARGAVGDATLVFDSGWLENMHANTIEPAPVEEESRDGRLALAFGPLAAGDRLVVYMQFQVNPTNVGRRSADVELYDGDELLVRVDRTIAVFP